MSTIIYVSTETSSVWNYAKDAPDETQPYLVRLSWLLDNPDGTTRRQGGGLVRMPVGERMPGPAAYATGIFDHNLATRGMKPLDMLAEFCEPLAEADLIVAHNWQTARKAIECSLRRAGMQAVVWPDVFDTHVQAKPILKIPLKRPEGGYRFPTNNETWQHFFGRTSQVSVDPVVDGFVKVRDIRAIFYAIKTLADREQVA